MCIRDSQGHNIENAIALVMNQEKQTKAKLEEKKALIETLRKEMKQAAKKYEFERATQLRDLILELESDL